MHGRPWRREQGTRFEFELAEAQGSVEDLQAAQLMDTATTARQDESGGGISEKEVNFRGLPPFSQVSWAVAHFPRGQAREGPFSSGGYLLVVSDPKHTLCVAFRQRQHGEGRRCLSARQPGRSRRPRRG